MVSCGDSVVEAQCIKVQMFFQIKFYMVADDFVHHEKSLVNDASLSC